MAREHLGTARQLELPAKDSREVLKPPLKWAGGKRWQVKHIQPIWQQFSNRRFVEPFCGGMAIALGLLPLEALLNDANPHLINFYAQLKRGLHIRLKMSNCEQCYYRSRDGFNSRLLAGRGDTAVAASLFYYLNRTGYNGLCRFNTRGEFNVPFGRHRTIAYRTDFGDYRNTFANWSFTSLDFENVVLHRDDFVYADPPYDVEFTRYSKDGFTWDDQVRLAKWLAKHPGPTVLSNQATPRIEKLYRGLGYD